MPISTSIDDLEPVAASNYPPGSASPIVIDNVLREHASYIAQLRDGKADDEFLQAGAGALSRTMQSKLRDAVSSKDFGAVGDGVADDSPALQLAINYCLANNKDLLIDGMCRLGSSLVVNRAVDGIETAAYFTIGSVSGGGFYVDTSIPMFTTTIPYGGLDPVSQLIKFSSIKFRALNSALDAFVLHGSRFLRISFVSCSFQRIRCVNATGYLQSYYFVNCNVRMWANTFFETTSISLDVHFTSGCIMESGQSAIAFGLPVGCSFTDGVIEGNSGVAITYRAARGLVVSGSYFEDNGVGDILGAGSSASFVSHNVLIQGNYFDAPSYNRPAVTWDYVTNGISVGNLFNRGGLGHSLTANSFVEIKDKALLEGLTNRQTFTYFREQQNLLPDSFGGAIRGYGVTGFGGRLGLGSLNDNVFTEVLTITEASSALPFVDNVINLGSTDRRFGSVFSREFNPGSGAVRWTSGEGNPEGVLVAPVGSLFTRTDGGVGTTLYVKESGAGNAGWVPK